MILVCGTIDEPVIQAFLTTLALKDIDFVLLDERYLLDGQVQMCLHIDDGKIFGNIDYGNWKLDIREITAIYNRFFISRALEEYLADFQEQIHFTHWLENLLNLITVKVANRPYATKSNLIKFFQYKKIIQAGFKVPNSNLGGYYEANLFPDNHKYIIKSASSERSIVREISIENIKKAHNLPPNQIQHLVRGMNIRVHVIGEKVLACQLATQALDYRYTSQEEEELNIIAIELPKDIRKKCVLLSQSLGLEFSGIDLLYSEEQGWFCFEVNPCPGYSWYEEHSELEIGDVLSEYLIRTP